MDCISTVYSIYDCRIFSFRYRFLIVQLYACITTFMRTLFNQFDLNLITIYKYIENNRQKCVRMCRVQINMGKRSKAPDSTDSHNYKLYYERLCAHIDNCIWHTRAIHKNIQPLCVLCFSHYFSRHTLFNTVSLSFSHFLFLHTPYISCTICYLFNYRSVTLH